MNDGNRVTRALASSGRAVGCFVQSPNPDVVEQIGHAGYDFVVIDLEHGGFAYEGALTLIRAANASGVTPLVRPLHADPASVGQLLDAGAEGVVVPRARSRADVESAISGARYSSGRGACPFTRAAGYLTDEWSTFSRRADSNNLVWVLIETLEALKNIDEILDTPGLNGVVTGPFDLASAMGHEGNVEHPTVQAALAEVLQKARARNLEAVAVGFSATPEESTIEMQRWANLGCRVFIPALDRGILATGLQALITSTQKVIT